MILYGLEYKECPVCKRICLKLEITFYGFCKDCIPYKKNCGLPENGVSSPLYYAFSVGFYIGYKDYKRFYLVP